MTNLIKSIDIHCKGEEYVKVEGFDKAIIGVDDKQMNFNIRNSYIGEHTPIYSWDLIII